MIIIGSTRPQEPLYTRAQVEAYIYTKIAQLTGREATKGLDSTAQGSQTYPRIEYSTQPERIDTHREGYYLDIDLIDKSASYGVLYELEDKLKNGFDFSRELTGLFYVRGEYRRTNDPQAEDADLKKLALQFYLTIERRFS